MQSCLDWSQHLAATLTLTNDTVQAELDTRWQIWCTPNAAGTGRRQTTTCSTGASTTRPSRRIRHVTNRSAAALHGLQSVHCTACRMADVSLLVDAPQSWLYGWALLAFDPAAFDLHKSRGYETPWSKLLLRWSVLFSDLIGRRPFKPCKT